MSKSQIKVPATYMRGGTSKGVFFKLDDLPESAQTPGESRDKLLLRIIGSPDPYGKQTDGMGGATSSTSKTVIVSKSTQVDHDVDYLFGQVSIDKAFVDWSGNCGNLTAAVGAFAISNGLVDAERVPENGIAAIRIWQANISKTIVVHVPIVNGQVQEIGEFELDGVTFPAAEVKIEFIDPSAGDELQEHINSNEEALAKLELIRAHGAVKMGLIDQLEAAATRQHTPKVAFVGKPQNYVASSGKPVQAKQIDLLVRAMSMGLLHHAMMGTAAVAIATAASIPGTLVNKVAGGGERNHIRFGHPSGTLRVGAQTNKSNGEWKAQKAIMSRSARILMTGWVHVPEQCS